MHVKNDAKKNAFEYLLKIKKHIFIYQTFDIQPYLKSKIIYPKMAQELFRWRTRMQEFKINFRNKYENTSCKLKCSHEDAQENILLCPCSNSTKCSKFTKS